jgi:hypothetical protein
MAPRVALLFLNDCFRRALRDDLAAAITAFRSKIEDAFFGLKVYPLKRKGRRD